MIRHSLFALWTVVLRRSLRRAMHSIKTAYRLATFNMLQWLPESLFPVSIHAVFKPSKQFNLARAHFNLTRAPHKCRLICQTRHTLHCSLITAQTHGHGRIFPTSQLPQHNQHFFNYFVPYGSIWVAIFEGNCIHFKIMLLHQFAGT